MAAVPSSEPTIKNYGSARVGNGEIAELAEKACSLVLLMGRTIGYSRSAVAWRRSGSQTHHFQAFHFEEHGKLLSKRSPASSKDFESEPGSIPLRAIVESGTA